MRGSFALVLLSGLMPLLVGCSEPVSIEAAYDTVLTGGRVIDPESGLDAIRNVGIQDGKVAVITEDMLSAEQVIDVSGLVISPGFIDLHDHGHNDEAYRRRVRDGVTSTFELEVGTSDVAGWYADRAGGQLINYGVSVGHIPVRMTVMGDEGELLPSGPGADQVATDQQIGEMADLFRDGFAQGAIAAGFGIVFTPAATMEELQLLLEIVAEYGASAHIHTRTTGSVDALAEAITLAKDAGASLHILHANSSGAEAIGEFLELIEATRAEGMDITTEAYPYEASNTYIESAMFADWETWSNERFNTFQWPDTGERLTRETFAQYRAEGGPVIEHARTEEMTRAAIASPLTMIASDAMLVHPRGAGSFAKVLGVYVRQEGTLTLPEALRKMTIEPALRLEERVPEMRQKGRIRVGADADLTVFNPDTVIDRATYTDPGLPSDGIGYVLVNGVVVVDGGEIVPGVMPGEAVRAATAF